jgi:hypothetical protein
MTTVPKFERNIVMAGLSAGIHTTLDEKPLCPSLGYLPSRNLVNRRCSMGDSERRSTSSLLFYDDHDHSRQNNVHDDEQVAREIQMALDLQEALEMQEEENQLATSSSSTPTRSRHDDPLGSSGYPQLDWNRLDHMLFVTCEVEGRLVEMLVDSGASSSCISYAMVQYLGLSRHFNSGVRGQATGAGTANILGLLENVSCQIGHVEFRLFFLVLDTEKPYLILGLDQMRRFSCVLDLENNQLLFGGRDGVSTPFLDRELAHAAATRSLPPEALALSRGGTVPGQYHRRPSSGASSNLATRFSSLFGRR